MTGIVYLIGAGPGDHKLITLKGKECIEKADVIVYDYLADAHFLSYAKEGAEIIYAGKKKQQSYDASMGNQRTSRKMWLRR